MSRSPIGWLGDSAGLHSIVGGSEPADELAEPILQDVPEGRPRNANGSSPDLQEFLRQSEGVEHQEGGAGSAIRFSALRSVQPVLLEWDMTVTAGRTSILSRSTGRAKPGEVCCILGPSGAGKSTLLNVLAGRQLKKKGFYIGGDLRVNGRVLEPWRLRPRVAYVMQKDEFFPTETPKEALAFSARLRLPAMRLRELEQEGRLGGHLTDLLVALGLEECCDRPIGGSSTQGISNGERKRVSIGVELITQPSIVFLDEPTTGLDSFAAWQVMRSVKALADGGCTVVCTVHQPSSEIFALIDRIICLCHQSTIFQGRASELSHWLEAGGYSCPPEHNPADFVMFIMETEPKGRLLQLSHAGRVSRPNSFRPSADAVQGRLNAAKLRKSFCLQLRCLVQREWRNLWRDSSSLQMRFVLTAALALLFSLVFIGIGEHTVLEDLRRITGASQFTRHTLEKGRFWRKVLHLGARALKPEVLSLWQQLQTELEYHYKAVVQVAFVAMFSSSQPTILSFPLERPVFLREYSANMYGTVAYFVAKLLVEVPLSAAQALLALAISHRLMRLQGSFLLMWLTVCLLCTCSVAFSLLIGCLVKFPRETGAIGPLVFTPQLLMSGTFIPVKAIPGVLRWMQYICFLQYAVKLLALVEFSQTDPTLRRLIFRTMEVNPELIMMYLALLLLMAVCFSWAAIVILTRKANSIY
mmetsp:Transcript_16906/g.39352  ORF Transcript_16906/g.39352 Transcript_16906/m.39352 type:complete len:697 (+) Transcript_16906:80-2170(+)